MEKKHKSRKWAFLLTFLMLLTVIGATGIFAKSNSEKNVIRVGYSDKGMMIKKNGDDVTGYAVQYLNLLSKYTGWEYEYVSIDEATRIDALKNGEIDLLCDVSEDEVERDNVILSNESSCMHYALICAREDDTSVFYNEFTAINGKRIAVNRSRKMDIMMEDFAQLHNLTYQPVYCASINQLENAIKEGRADLMVTSNQRDLEGYKFVAKAGIRRQYFATASDKQSLMDTLNEADLQLKLQQPFIISSLYETWYGRPSEILVGETREEYNFVNNQTPVRVVCDADSFPVEYQDPQTGKFQGVIADAMDLIQKESGLNFKFLPQQKYMDAWKMLQDGEADMSAGMYLNDAEKETYGILSSISYLDSSYTLIIRKDRTFSDDLTIILPENALDIQAFVSEKHPEWTILPGADNESCLNKCEAGDADGTIMDSVFLQTVYNFNSFQHLQISPMHSVKIPMSCAFAGPDAQLLCDIVNKAIRRIPKSSFDNCIIENSVEITYEPGLLDILNKFLPALLVITAAFILFSLLSLRYKEQHFHHLAMTDTVTGLWNDICFRQEVSDVLSHPRKTDYQLISMDLEHFRYANSDFGEKNADLILQIIGKRIREIFGNKAMYAREMGDVFLILTQPLADPELVAEALGSTITLNINDIVQHYLPSLKFGVCEIPSKADTLPVSEYIDRANEARKTIKGSTTAQFAYFDAKMEEFLSNERRIEKKMADALSNHEFLVYYQPKYDLLTNCLMGAEALVRWKDPEEGMIFPNTFIPVFERNGFIIQLDFFVYEEVLKTLAKWQNEGRKPIVVSVNVSRAHIGTGDFLTKLVKLADYYKVPHSLLELELTETVLGGKHADIRQFIVECRNAGFPVSIDDFGSGYSSLNLLKELPIDVLKIDREFLNETEVSEKSCIIIEEIVQMAARIEIHTICEGVETESQANFLRNIGCNMAQGYLYSRPVPLAAFEALM